MFAKGRQVTVHLCAAAVNFRRTRNSSMTFEGDEGDEATRRRGDEATRRR
ncbi:hypothetical protein [Rhodococcoides fascians]|nr:hypothetical protein [Rhodococcus fascians]